MKCVPWMVGCGIEGGCWQDSRVVPSLGRLCCSGSRDVRALLCHLVCAVGMLYFALCTLQKVFETCGVCTPVVYMRAIYVLCGLMFGLAGPCWPGLPLPGDSARLPVSWFGLAVSIGCRVACFLRFSSW